MRHDGLFYSSHKLFLVLAMTAGIVFSTVKAYAATAPQAVRQIGNVKGTVVDTNGEPIIGATVKIQGGKTGTITDIDGKFVLANTNGGTRLIVSYIGYKTQEVHISNAPMTITLQENNATLNEIVVIGYGTMRKKDLTGSVVQIRPDKLANENPGTVQDVLRGTPGLNVGYDAGAKGGGSLEIRGQRSVYNEGGHNSPLIILDGMAFYGELSEINPDDIGQIDVLKDASAAAIYGSKAANGVIIITTKNGKQGKPTINVSVNLRPLQNSSYNLPFLNIFLYLYSMKQKLSSPSFADLFLGQRKVKQTFFSQINTVIDWAPIRAIIEVAYTKGYKSTGRPSYDSLVFIQD